jgi:beta-lactamase regulating signal transducer with metallopeptidase domain
MDSVTLARFAELFAERLVLCLFAGTALVLVVGILLRRGRFGSRMRYFVWWSVLGAATLLLVPQIAPSAGHIVSTSDTAPLTLPTEWAIYALALWVIGTLFALARLGYGAIRLRRLRSTCTALPEDRFSSEIRGAINSSKRAVTVSTSSAVTVPCVLGFFRPTVVIPSDLLEQLSEAELKQVLIHEIAHIRFWDDWANLTQKFLRAILFFHPAAWFIDRQLAVEREMACDDFVVQQTGDSRAYARCLTSLAELSLVRRTAALVQAALGRRTQTTARVTRLLGGSTTVNQRLHPALSVAGVILVTAFSIRSFTPTLVSFSNPVHTSSEIAQHIAATQQANKTAAPVQLASFHAPRMAQPIMRKKAVARPAEPVLRLALAKPQQPEQIPNVMLATAKTQSMQTLHVQQAYFAVVGSDDEGFQSVSIYQLTVWHVTSTAIAKSADHKRT